MNISLTDGLAVPALGIGTFQIPDSQVAPLVRRAIDLGVKLIDTAAIYGNERGVGDGVRGVEDVYVQTKLWNDRHEDAEAALDESLALLGLDAVDMYLIHWPHPTGGNFVAAWETLVRLRAAGKARSIGVSNFMPEHIEAIVAATGVSPVLNQIELHPTFQQRELVEYHRAHGIVTQSWSPLGQGALLKNQTVGEIAEAQGTGAASVIIAWHLAKGYSVIPRSGDPVHLADNLRAAEVTLTPDEVAVLDALDDADGRIGPDPYTF